jgi:predicted metalloprotease with PDZ domain
VAPAAPTWPSLCMLTLLAAGSLPAQQPAPAAGPPVSNIRYEIRFDSATAADRSVRIGMRFEVGRAGPVLLSLPAWTPGAYELSNYARKVSGFSASGSAGPLVWDRADPDTWRIRAVAAGPIRIEFDFLADSLDNAMAWSRSDFLLVNGTNVFHYPEGMGLEFPAEVEVTTAPGWQVVSGLEGSAATRRFRSGNYHDLVDMPFFIGRLDVDSTQIEGVWHRLASYPSGALRTAGRRVLWDHIRAMVPPQSKVFGETPWPHYTTMLIFDSSYGGGSALEHQNSHVGIYNPEFIGTPLLASITAHEIFHAWNVKRLRPAELVPYRYDQPQPTTLLWVSEGITDYYADLALVRGGIIDSIVFMSVTEGKRQHTEQTVPVALEDASLTTWIDPADGTGDIYYDKGSLAGLLLDALIRDGSDNRRSLDDVMRGLYLSHFKRGKGFSTADWWAAVSAAAGGRPVADFAARYIDGREPLPWNTIGVLAGIRLASDTVRELRLGVSTLSDSSLVVVTGVAPGSAAAVAGIEPGDQLLRVGEVEVKDEGFALLFRARYDKAEGTTIPVLVRRGEVERTLQMPVRRETIIDTRLAWDPAASPKAARIRHGILTGTTTGTP